MDFSGIKIDPGTIFSSIGSLAKDIREVVTGEAITDPIKKAEVALKAQELDLKLMQINQAIDLGQIEINKEEAKSGSFFAAGWRPGAGWSCVVGLLYTFIIQPLSHWFSLIYEFPAPPEIDTIVLMQLLFALLGLGTLRSFERVKGKIK